MQIIAAGLLDWAKVLCPIRHRIGHFGDVPQANLLAWYRKTKPDTTKGRIHQSKQVYYNTKPPHHNRLTALFPGPPGWAGARIELLDFMVQGKINRGRHTNHLAGRHSIRTYRPNALPAAQPSVKALKATTTTAK